jgi:hypothetical protein
MKIFMKRGLELLQDGCGCPTLDAIVSLSLRDGGLVSAPGRLRLGGHRAL